MTSHSSAPRILKYGFFVAFWTTIVVIAAGSIVRTTGSGLGCPDWPKCFGFWVPPTDVAELPIDYKTKFQIAGKQIADFDAFKTWTEYLNRLVGVLLGLVLVFLAAVATVYRRRISKKILKGTWYALLLVVLQGALGAIVVATHLHGQTITLHLALAIALAVLLSRLKNQVCVNPDTPNTFIPTKPWLFWAKLSYLLAITQVFLGTKVRYSIDHLVHEFVAMPRAEWAYHLNWVFLVHRSFSLVFLFAAFVWYKKSREIGSELNKLFYKLGTWVVLSITTGVVLRELGFPAWAQPAHLVLASLMIVSVDQIYQISKKTTNV